MCKHLLAVLALLITGNLLKAQCLGSCCSAGCNSELTNHSSSRKGDWQVTTAYSIMQYQPFSDDELKQWSTEENPVFSVTSQQSFRLGAQYNFTDRWKVAMAMPYNLSFDNREGHTHEENHKEIHNYGNDFGYGDATLLGKYRWLKLDDNSWSLETGLGIKMPTGETNTASSNSIVVPLHLQPGTGSWDPVASVQVRKTVNRWIFSEDVYTKIATTAKEHNMGDYVTGTTTASYQVTSTKKEQSVKVLLLGGVQVEYNSKMKMPIDHVHGTETMTDTPVPFDNSGFTRLLFSAGTLIYAGKHFTIPVSFSLPVYEHLNGYQVSMKWKTMAGLNINL